MPLPLLLMSVLFAIYVTYTHRFLILPHQKLFIVNEVDISVENHSCHSWSTDSRKTSRYSSLPNCDVISHTFHHFNEIFVTRTQHWNFCAVCNNIPFILGLCDIFMYFCLLAGTGKSTNFRTHIIQHGFYSVCTNFIARLLDNQNHRCMRFG